LRFCQPLLTIMQQAAAQMLSDERALEFSGAPAREFFFGFGVQIASDLSHLASAKAINAGCANPDVP
jgi:hypothetical protein